MRYLAPAYVYTPQGLKSHLTIAVNEDGSIAALSSERPKQADVQDLPNVALLPGFVNAHSHVFQRALRGHTHRPLAQQDTFWTWRNAMYAEAQRLDPDQLYESAVQTYREMLSAGYTSVGEFHYVHHQTDGQPYAEPNAMALAVLQAGKDVGIRVVLLMTAYVQGGFGRPLEEGQLRFGDRSLASYLERVERLRADGWCVGMAPHSIRAVPETWFRAIAERSRRDHLPLHVHADEQMAEVEQCQQTYGCTPVELLARFEALGPLTTIVHATHCDHREIALLAEHDCTVCVCPTTEGDLGDGIAPYAELVTAQIPLAIGSDSNTRLDPMEELRWAEYTARMRYQRRRVLVADERSSPGPLLLEYGTHRGAAALGLATGSIEAGKMADFVAIDLNHPTLSGWNEQDLLDVLFFGASVDVIKYVWVAGNQVIA